MLFKNVSFLGLVTPFVYVIFIMLMAFETPSIVLILLGFTMGIIIDSFIDTGGLHAAALTFSAYCRPWVLRNLAPRNNYVFGTTPTVYHYGVGWFLKYAFVFIAIHYFVFLLLETLLITDEGIILNIGKLLLNVFFTVLITLFAQIFIRKS